MSKQAPQDTSLFDLEPRPNSEPRELVHLERFHAVYSSAGFLPTSGEEITRALGLLNYRSRDGAAREMSAILKHQQNKSNTDKPNAAVRSVAHTMVGYFNNARLTGANLREVTAYDLETIPNPNLTVLPHVIDDVARLGAADLVRFIDLRNLSELPPQTDPKKLDFNPLKTDYSKVGEDEDLANHVARTLAATTIGEARGIVDLAIEDQINRAKFWHAQLEGSMGHPDAAPIVAQALGGIGLNEYREPRAS